MASNTLLDLFDGPAVVIDNQIGDPDALVQGLLSQLESHGFPLLRHDTLPENSTVSRHWSAVSFIVLDWNLYVDMESGVAVPAGLQKQNDKAAADFISHVLLEASCPIFVVSSYGEARINSILDNLLDKTVKPLRDRVMVWDRSDVKGDLLSKLEDWLTGQPAVYALKVWSRAHDAARQQLFNDFQASSPHWPAIIWATAQKDSTNADFEIAEMISRNLLHRIDVHEFDEEVILEAASSPTMASSAIQKVLHHYSVIAADRLPPNQLMPGDFFYDRIDDGDPPEEIHICLTPACDLVPRSSSNPTRVGYLRTDPMDDVRLLVVTAKKFTDHIAAVRKLQKKGDTAKDSTTEDILHTLLEEAVPYRVQFSTWREIRWSSMKHTRQGRLMDPYVTRLQQKFALYSQRQGLPRLPDGFYPEPV